MPDYASDLEFVKQFGAKYSAELLDRSNDNNLTAKCLLATAAEGDLSPFTIENKAAAVDAVALINQHLIDAENEINSYLSTRYILPIIDDISSTPLKRLTCDIARYLIASTADMMSEIIHERYSEAIAWLKNVSLNKVKLAISVVPSVQTNDAVNQSDIAYATGQKSDIDDY